MGYGPVTPGGKQLPITPWKGSWAEQEQMRKLGGLPRLRHTGVWPLGMNPNGTYVSQPTKEKK